MKSHSILVTGVHSEDLMFAEPAGCHDFSYRDGDKIEAYVSELFPEHGFAWDFRVTNTWVQLEFEWGTRSFYFIPGPMPTGQALLDMLREYR